MRKGCDGSGGLTETAPTWHHSWLFSSQVCGFFFSLSLKEWVSLSPWAHLSPPSTKLESVFLGCRWRREEVFYHRDSQNFKATPSFTLNHGRSNPTCPAEMLFKHAHKDCLLETFGLVKSSRVPPGEKMLLSDARVMCIFIKTVFKKNQYHNIKKKFSSLPGDSCSTDIQHGKDLWLRFICEGDTNKSPYLWTLHYSGEPVGHGKPNRLHVGQLSHV